MAEPFAPALGLGPARHRAAPEPESAAARRHHPDPTTHEVQALAELGPATAGVIDDERIEFIGESFRLATRPATMALLKFSNAADAGLDSMEVAGLAALYAVIRGCILDHDPNTRRPTEASLKEWARFERHADEVGADGDELMEFVTTAMERINARPQRRPGPSSAGPPTTSGGSKASPTLPDTGDLGGLISVDSLLDR